MREHLQRDIEALFQARTRRQCLFVPSGRLALHILFRALLRPGDRILMSPLEDDTVFFGALAAGIRPVMAPVSIRDGNIDPEGVSDSVWSSIAAVLTTNMYGLPDQVIELRSRCDRLGIPLIEDAAHALETEVEGGPIGSFGIVSAFSLSKHIAGVGGVVTFATGTLESRIAGLLDELVLARAPARRVGDASRSAVKGLLDACSLGYPARRARQMLHTIKRTTWRIPLQASRLEDALAGRSLDQFDPWMRTAYPDYRMQQRPSGLTSTLASLRDLDRDREKRVEGVLRLRELDAVAPAVREGAARPLLRVPLLIEDRNAVANELTRRGINVYFIYDPPLDDYAGPAFADPSPAPEVARWWARHVLPVDPRHAGRVLEALQTIRVPLRPAAPPHA